MSETRAYFNNKFSIITKISWKIPSQFFSHWLWDHFKPLHIKPQHSCYVMYKILSWSMHWIMEERKVKFPQYFNYNGQQIFSAMGSCYLPYSLLELTHWGRVTHICVGKLTIIGSDNGLSPGRRQAITWTNVGILLIGPPRTNFNEMLIEIHTFSLKKIHLKMSSGKWRPFCLGLNVLKLAGCQRPVNLPYFTVNE